MDEGDRKASMRAVWSKRQKHKHSVSRKRHSSRDGRGSMHPGAWGLRVAEQRDRYDEAIEETGVEGEDYEEWLAMCPKEPPEVLVRQRALLPDVDFLRRTLTGDDDAASLSENTSGGLDLKYMASVLSSITRIQDVLDVPDETMLVMFGEKPRLHGVGGQEQPQSTPDTTCDAGKEHSVTATILSNTHDDENAAHVSVDDVLAAAMDNHMSLTVDHPVSREEQDDLDAWFDTL